MFHNVSLVVILCISCVGCKSNVPASTQKSGTPREPTATIEGNVALAFSPDGNWLAIGAELIDTNTWDIAAVLEQRVSEDHPQSKNHWGYTSAAFSPDSKKLALGDQDGTLRILAVPSMALTQETLAHGARITGIGFAADNKTIVTTSVDDLLRIRIWDSASGDEVFRSVDSGTFPAEINETTVDIVKGVDIFALSPDRELFAVADVMSKVVIFHVRDGSVLHQFMGPNADTVEMDSLAFSANTSKLLIGVTPKVYVYDLNGGALLADIETTADSQTLQVKTVNDDGLIAMSYTDLDSGMPVMELYSLTEQKSLVTFFPHEMRGAFWDVSHDGKYIATTGRGGPVRIWTVTEALQSVSQR